MCNAPTTFKSSKEIDGVDVEKIVVGMMFSLFIWQNLLWARFLIGSGKFDYGPLQN